MAVEQSQFAVLDASAASINLASVLEGGEHRPYHVIARLGKVPRFFRRYLDTVGDGTGTKNANVDYSSGNVPFKIVPAAGTIMLIEKLSVLIGDTTNLNNDGYGAGAELTNGIKVEKWNGATVDDYTDELTIKTMYDWAFMAGRDVQMTFGSGPSHEHHIYPWRPASPIRLVGDDDEDFRLNLNDNFSGLHDHNFIVEGIIETVIV